LNESNPPRRELPPGWWQRVRHDLRGAVAPVRMAVQLLRSGRVDAAEREEALAVIDRQLEQLLAGIDDVGDLLRLQAGLPLLQHATQDANLLLDVVCGRGGLIRGLAERDLRLLCEPCESELAWPHDPARVAALLEFLLLRAAAHSPAGSELRMALRRAEDGAELVISGAGAGLAQDPEIAYLLGDAGGGDDPGLRAILMREVLLGNAIEMRRADGDALSLLLRGISG
jgi:signal transduction histidine kinase